MWLLNFFHFAWGPTPTRHLRRCSPSASLGLGLAWPRALLPRPSCLFDHVMTSAERRFSTRSQVVDKLAGALRGLALVPRVVHHDHWRTIAGTQTLDFDQRERAGRIGLAGLDPE